MDLPYGLGDIIASRRRDYVYSETKFTLDLSYYRDIIMQPEMQTVIQMLESDETRAKLTQWDYWNLPDETLCLLIKIFFEKNRLDVIRDVLSKYKLNPKRSKDLWLYFHYKKAPPELFELLQAATEDGYVPDIYRFVVRYPKLNYQAALWILDWIANGIMMGKEFKNHLNLPAVISDSLRSTVIPGAIKQLYRGMKWDVNMKNWDTSKFAIGSRKRKYARKYCK